MKWIDLSARTKLKLTGPDRVRYLNGQVSNQVKQDLSEKAIWACVCNLKGKIEALISITERDGVLFIDCDAALREELFARLDRYLIADDCELEDVTDEYQLWHGLGENGGSAGVKGIISDRFGKSGCDVWLPTGEDFSGGDERLCEEAAEKMRIEHGIPKWGHELTGEEFPAEVGLENRAVDFHKGCYLGQEIVSRIKSVGKVKRELVLLSSDDGEFTFGEPGSPLELNGEVCGKITSFSQDGPSALALALVKRSFTEQAEAGTLPDSLVVREFRTT